MNIQTARDEYALALRQGQKEYRELIMAGRRTSPAVLDEILPENAGETVQEVGLVEIPASRIVGTKSAEYSSSIKWCNCDGQFVGK